MWWYFLLLFLNDGNHDRAMGRESQENIPPSDKEMNSVSEACNHFSFDLLRQLQEPGSNAFFSSYSICTVFAMVWLGAKGETALQLRNTFHYEDGQERVGAVYKKLISEYNNPTNSKFTLSTGNRIYGSKDFKLNKSYKDKIENCFMTEIKQLDFSSGKVEEIINNWVRRQTNDKIKELFPQGSISEDSSLLLANAIYFKGNWQIKFKKERTGKQQFRISRKKIQMVDMMTVVSHFPFTDDRHLNAKVLQMPYKGNRLSMLIILPNTVFGLSNVLQRLDSQKLMSLLNAPKTEVEVSFPKFKLTTEYELSDDLQALQLKDVFSDASDLSGISKEPLLISDVRHKAFIQVDEEGTEAAAATGVYFARSLIDDSEVFSCDHPFYFAIVDNVYRLILFSGIVVDPTKTS